MKWAVGLITVPSRRETLFPRTLASLEAAGFDRPRVFIDGDDDALAWYRWSINAVVRGDPLGNFGNWYLGLAELYCRNPDADRFLMFEDDLVAVRGLREYLEATPMPDRGYCNLYTGGEGNPLLAEKQAHPGWFHSDQRAAGALGLMFDNQTTTQLLGSLVFVRHLQQMSDGMMRVDGAVCLALRSDPRATVSEYVHKPSLIQHTGSGASLIEPIRRKMGLSVHQYEQPMTSPLFPGEEFDARELIKP